jgi:hypothetical protein
VLVLNEGGEHMDKLTKTTGEYVHTDDSGTDDSGKEVRKPINIWVNGKGEIVKMKSIE